MKKLFVVAQMGSRRSYAVPLILQEAGMLEAFYTDFAGNVGCGPWLIRASRLLGLRSAAERLGRRQIPPPVIPKARTLGHPVRWLAHRLLARRGNSIKRFRHQLKWSFQLGTKVNRNALGSATHLYSFLGEFGPILQTARAAGLSIVTEFYIMLGAERIVRAEQKLFPQWEPPERNFDIVRDEFPAERGLLSLVDFALCPSNLVQFELEAEFGFESKFCRVVPYGIEAHWLELQRRLLPRRILFVGTAGLRKGIHYLAMAFQHLVNRGYNYEFIVAGDVTTRIARRPECRGLRFLGRIPRRSVQMEFMKADVFVLPTLAEGSAEVIYEALAAGLPVITTKSAGSVVRDGIEGILVAERDPVALADAIKHIVENRKLRERFSAAARMRARLYTMLDYRARLIVSLDYFGK